MKRCWFCFRVWIDENKKLLHHRDTKNYSCTLVRESKPWKGVIPKKCAFKSCTVGACIFDYLKIKCEEAQIVLLLASSIVWHIFHHHLHCVYVCVHLKQHFDAILKINNIPQIIVQSGR